MIGGKVLKSLHNKANHAPISAHPLFGPLVALWFATLFGMGSFVLPSSLYESILGSPLGFGKRVLITLVAGAIGAALGLWGARKISLKAENSADPERTRSITERGTRSKTTRPPLSVHDEMDDDPLPRPAAAASPLTAMPDLDLQPQRRRPLVNTSPLQQDDPSWAAIAAEEDDLTLAETARQKLHTSMPLAAEPAQDALGTDTLTLDEPVLPQAQPFTEAQKGDDVWSRAKAHVQDKEQAVKPPRAPGMPTLSSAAPATEALQLRPIMAVAPENPPAPSPTAEPITPLQRTEPSAPPSRSATKPIILPIRSPANFAPRPEHKGASTWAMPSAILRAPCLMAEAPAPAAAAAVEVAAEVAVAPATAPTEHAPSEPKPVVLTEVSPPTPAEPVAEAPVIPAVPAAQSSAPSQAATHTERQPYTERSLDQLSVVELVERLAHAIYDPHAQVRRPVLAPAAPAETPAPEPMAKATFASVYRPLPAFDQSAPEPQDNSTSAPQPESAMGAHKAVAKQSESPVVRKESDVTDIAEERRNRAEQTAGTTEQALRAALASLQRSSTGTA